MNLTKKQIMKIANESFKETMLDFEYENGSDKEAVKKLYDETNEMMLSMLKHASKTKNYDFKTIDKLRKEIAKENFKFTLQYLYTIIKFIGLTILFAFIFYLLNDIIKSEKTNTKKVACAI